MESELDSDALRSVFEAMTSDAVAQAIVVLAEILRQRAVKEVC